MKALQSKIKYLQAVIDHVDNMRGEMDETEWQEEMDDIRDTLEVMGDMAESMQGHDPNNLVRFPRGRQERAEERISLYRSVGK